MVIFCFCKPKIVVVVFLFWWKWCIRACFLADLINLVFAVILFGKYEVFPVFSSSPWWTWALYGHYLVVWANLRLRNRFHVVLVNLQGHCSRFLDVALEVGHPKFICISPVSSFLHFLSWHLSFQCKVSLFFEFRCINISARQVGDELAKSAWLLFL